MWSVEQLMGQFIGPPLAGVLIAAGIAVPFSVDAALLVLAAGLVWLIRLQPAAPVRSPFWAALREGIRFMRRDGALLRLAIVLGCANVLATAVVTVQALFAQDVLGLNATGYGLVLSVEAVGAIAGSMCAPALLRHLGQRTCLVLAIGVWAIGYVVAGLSAHPAALAGALGAVMLAAMVWNVITVSWRQRRIPAPLLGRVNSIYRFFGWGAMPLGALAGGAFVALVEPTFGREWALRAPLLGAGAACAALAVYARLRLSLD
jgi:MFS family permease